MIGGFFFLRSRNKAEVVSTTVQRSTVREELVLSGSIKADNHTILSFPTPGKLSWVGVSQGDQVYKGQALMSLDKTLLSVSLSQAMNNYRSAQATANFALDSVQGHQTDENFSQIAARTQAEVARDNAYDAVRAARYNLANATLFTPFSGTVAHLSYTHTGIHIPAQGVIEIVDPSTIYFQVEADQGDVTSLSSGQEVNIILDSREKELKGRVVFIALTPQTGQSETTYQVKISLNSIPDSGVRVGMTGDAKFILSQKQDVLSVPLRYINTDRDGTFVYLGKPGNKVYVDIGVEGEDLVEITSGVNQGDIVYD